MGITIKATGTELKKWNSLMRSIISEARSGVYVGVLDNATNDEGEVIAEYAAVNEFGGPHVPSRPFLRSTLKEKTDNWIAIFRRSITGNLVKDPTSIRRGFAMVGRVAMMDIKEKIMSNMPPPNDPVYAASKVKKNGGYSGTLFNTGALYKAINFELVNDGSLKKK